VRSREEVPRAVGVEPPEEMRFTTFDSVELRRTGGV
jgi:hypothetical protein